MPYHVPSCPPPHTQAKTTRRTPRPLPPLMRRASRRRDPAPPPRTYRESVCASPAGRIFRWRLHSLSRIAQAAAGVPVRVGPSIDDAALGFVVGFKEGGASTRLPAVAAQTIPASRYRRVRFPPPPPLFVPPCPPPALPAPRSCRNRRRGVGGGAGRRRAWRGRGSRGAGARGVLRAARAGKGCGSEGVGDAFAPV